MSRAMTTGLPERALDRRTVGIEELADAAVARGLDHLLSLQRREGYWLGELGADTTLESDYIFYLSVLGRTDRVGKLPNRVPRPQPPHCRWKTYVGGPSQPKATRQTYLPPQPPRGPARPAP